MNNLHLFELINAPPGLDSTHLMLAVILARWAIYTVPLVMAVAWVRGGWMVRNQLLELVTAALIALSIAQLVTHLWPQPRPFALHMGTQYLAHDDDPGLPSDHVTAIWSLALAALTIRELAVWAFPLLALGLVVGLSRIYLGVHFPFDVLAAFPVAMVGAIAARALRSTAQPLRACTIDCHDRLIQVVRRRLSVTRKT